MKHHVPQAGRTATHTVSPLQREIMSKPNQQLEATEVNLTMIGCLCSLPSKVLAVT